MTNLILATERVKGVGYFARNSLILVQIPNRWFAINEIQMQRRGSLLVDLEANKESSVIVLRNSGNERSIY